MVKRRARGEPAQYRRLKSVEVSSLAIVPVRGLAASVEAITGFVMKNLGSVVRYVTALPAGQLPIGVAPSV